MKKGIILLINYICLIPFLMVLSTTLIIDNSLVNGVVAAKYFWFYLSVGLISVTSIVSYLINHQNVKFNVIDVPIILFGVLGISAYLLSTYMITTKVILFVLIIALYFYFKIFLVQFRWNKFLLVISFITLGLVEAIWGLQQLYGFSSSQHSLFKITGSFFNPGPYAGFLAMVFPMCLYYVFNDWKILKIKYKRIYFPYYYRLLVAVLCLFCISCILPATCSRASWIAALGGSLFVYILYFLKQKGNSNIPSFLKKHKKKLLVSIGSFILMLLVASAFLYNMKKDSADGRFLIWKISHRLIADNPIGVGLGHFSGSYGKKQAAYFASTEASETEKLVAGNPEYAFNEYLQLCVEFGVIPFLFFLSIILGSVYIGIKRKKTPLVGALLALLIFAFMSYPFSILPFLIAFVFVIAMCLSEKHEITCKTDLKGYYISSYPHCILFNRIFVGLLLISLMFVIYLCLHNRYPTYSAYKDWSRAKMLLNSNQYREANEYYLRLYSQLKDQTSFLFEYGQSLSQIGEYKQSNEIFILATRFSCDPMFYNIMGKNHQALKEYTLAESNFKKAANIVPSRIYPYYLLANMYAEKGDSLKAIEMAKYVIEKNPKVNSPAIREMKENMKKLINKDMP